MTITRIGNLDVVLPDKPNLRFSDGDAVRKDMMIDTCATDLATNNFKIRILVPEHFKMYSRESNGPKTYAEFYVGLFEGMFETLRDNVFPHLKADGNRRKFTAVGENDKPVEEVFREIVAPAWETYAPFENYLSERVKFGLIDANGEIAVADLDEEGFIFSDGIEDDNLTMLSMFMSKYSKGLDTMFLSDFKSRHNFVNGEYVSPNRGNPIAAPS